MEYCLLVTNIIWTASSEFGTYCLCEQRRFRRACASAQSRQNLRCSLIQAVSQEEPSDRKPDPWPLWMAGHAQLKFVMTECSKTQIRLTGLIYLIDHYCDYSPIPVNMKLIVCWLEVSSDFNVCVWQMISAMINIFCLKWNQNVIRPQNCIGSLWMDR